MLIDYAPDYLVNKVIVESLNEIGQRLPIHSIHRWWSRRFAAIYRFLLAAYLFDDINLIEEALRRPQIMRNFSRNKTFLEPFSGGGTGLVEASIAGWNVYGVDINPVAVRICKTSLNLSTGKILHEQPYAMIAIEALDRALKALQNLWIYEDDYMIIYSFISRDKAPTWLTTYLDKGERSIVTICNNCFETNITKVTSRFPQEIKCPVCCEKYPLSIRGIIDLGKVSKLPIINDKWKVYALELRRIINSKKYERKIINLLKVEKETTREWLRKSIEKAEFLQKKILREMYPHLHYELTFLNEGKRLAREGNIIKLYQLFTPKQLVSLHKFAEEVNNLINDKNYIKELYHPLFSLAVSEAAKVSCLATKWHPPIGEPVPAGAMKTYWIPEHTVEANPLAHVYGSLKTIGRCTIASIIKRHIKAIKHLKEKYDVNEELMKQINFNVFHEDATKVNFSKEIGMIDLCVVDPPYIGKIRSYTELSLIHHAALTIYDETIKNSYIDIKNQYYKFSLEEILKREIGISINLYKDMLLSIFLNLVQCMNMHSRLVLIYSATEEEKWIPPLYAAAQAGLRPVISYWLLGEVPGGLARSHQRGIFLVIMKKNEAEDDEATRIKIIFQSPLFAASTKIKINKEVEEKAKNAFVAALKSIYKVQIIYM